MLAWWVLGLGCEGSAGQQDTADRCQAAQQPLCVFDAFLPVELSYGAQSTRVGLREGEEKPDQSGWARASLGMLSPLVKKAHSATVLDYSPDWCSLELRLC